MSPVSTDFRLIRDLLRRMRYEAMKCCNSNDSFPEVPTVFDLDLDKTEEDPENGRIDFGDEADEINLGKSLEGGQDYPLIVRRHTLAGWFILVDGHRRCRAARRVGLKILKAVLVDKKLSASETRLIQIRTDIHKKKLSPPELSALLIALEKENPGTVKQIAALVHMEESLVWKYLQAKKLSAESLAAFKAGKIGLRDMVAIAALPADEQPVLLGLKLGGASAEEVGRQSRKRRHGSTASSTEQVKAIKLTLDGKFVFVMKGPSLSLDVAIDKAEAVVTKLKEARRDGHTAKTIRAWLENKPAKKVRSAKNSSVAD